MTTIPDQIVVMYTPFVGEPGAPAVPAEVIRELDERECEQDQGPMFEIQVLGRGESQFVHEGELSYPPYEVPLWQARALTLRQWLRLAVSCRNYRVPFDPTHYQVVADDANWTPGFAEGWVGGYEHAQGNKLGNRPTIYLGVEPSGRSHS